MTQETTSADKTIVKREFARADLSSPMAVAQATDLSVMCQRAEILVQSHLLPQQIDSWQKAVAIMLRGKELGISDWTALQHISVVNGNPQPDGQLCLALIQRSGLLRHYEIVESTEERCTIRMKRVNQPMFDVTCTIGEATRLGLTGKDNWKKQPKSMLFWYTLKQGARRLFSDVLNGMAGNKGGDVVVVDDETYDAEFTVDEEANYREGEPSAAPSPLSVSTSDENAESSAANAASDEPVVGANNVQIVDDPSELTVWPNDQPRPTDMPQVGALNMNSLQERAINGGYADNPFHFANLLRKLMDGKEVHERMTADQVLDVMRKHKAAKEFAS
jgi:hypothetical protein